MAITIGTGILRPQRQTEAIEGPTRAQALRMAQLRVQYLARAAEHQAAGRDTAAFEADCAAWDLERDLAAYGFDPITGQPKVRR